MFAIDIYIFLPLYSDFYKILIILNAEDAKSCKYNSYLIR